MDSIDKIISKEIILEKQDKKIIRGILGLKEKADIPL